MKSRDRRLRLRRLIRGSGGVWGRRRPLWVRLLPAVLVPVLLAVPLVMLLPKAFGLMGVLYSMPAADIITFIASVIVILRADQLLRK